MDAAVVSSCTRDELFCAQSNKTLTAVIVMSTLLAGGPTGAVDVAAADTQGSISIVFLISHDSCSQV